MLSLSVQYESETSKLEGMQISPPTSRSLFVTDVLTTLHTATSVPCPNVLCQPCHFLELWPTCLHLEVLCCAPVPVVPWPWWLSTWHQIATIRILCWLTPQRHGGCCAIHPLRWWLSTSCSWTGHQSYMAGFPIHEIQSWQWKWCERWLQSART